MYATRHCRLIASRCRPSIWQGFRTPEEVKRFGDMMDEMCHIVATKHSGSLKGEHSTGRNMAPYVELEWGAKARPDHATPHILPRHAPP